MLTVLGAEGAQTFYQKRIAVPPDYSGSKARQLSAASNLSIIDQRIYKLFTDCETLPEKWPQCVDSLHKSLRKTHPKLEKIEVGLSVIEALVKIANNSKQLEVIPEIWEQQFDREESGWDSEVERTAQQVFIALVRKSLVDTCDSEFEVAYQFLRVLDTSPQFSHNINDWVQECVGKLVKELKVDEIKRLIQALSNCRLPVDSLRSAIVEALNACTENFEDINRRLSNPNLHKQKPALIALLDDLKERKVRDPTIWELFLGHVAHSQFDDVKSTVWLEFAQAEFPNRTSAAWKHAFALVKSCDAAETARLYCGASLKRILELASKDDDEYRTYHQVLLNRALESPNVNGLHVQVLDAYFTLIKAKPAAFNLKAAVSVIIPKIKTLIKSNDKATLSICCELLLHFLGQTNGQISCNAIHEVWLCLLKYHSANLSVAALIIAIGKRLIDLPIKDSSDVVPKLCELKTEEAGDLAFRYILKGISNLYRTTELSKTKRKEQLDSFLKQSESAVAMCSAKITRQLMEACDLRAIKKLPKTSSYCELLELLSEPAAASKDCGAACFWKGLACRALSIREPANSSDKKQDDAVFDPIDFVCRNWPAVSQHPDVEQVSKEMFERMCQDLEGRGTDYEKIFREACTRLIETFSGVSLKLIMNPNEEQKLGSPHVAHLIDFICTYDWEFEDTKLFVIDAVCDLLTRKTLKSAILKKGTESKAVDSIVGLYLGLDEWSKVSSNGAQFFADLWKDRRLQPLFKRYFDARPSSQNAAATILCEVLKSRVETTVKAYECKAADAKDKLDEVQLLLKTIHDFDEAGLLIKNRAWEYVFDRLVNNDILPVYLHDDLGTALTNIIDSHVFLRAKEIQAAQKEEDEGKPWSVKDCYAPLGVFLKMFPKSIRACERYPNASCVIFQSALHMACMLCLHVLHSKSSKKIICEELARVASLPLDISPIQRRGLTSLFGYAEVAGISTTYHFCNLSGDLLEVKFHPDDDFVNPFESVAKETKCRGMLALIDYLISLKNIQGVVLALRLMADVESEIFWSGSFPLFIEGMSKLVEAAKNYSSADTLHHSLFTRMLRPILSPIYIKDKGGNNVGLEFNRSPREALRLLSMNNPGEEDKLLKIFKEIFKLIETSLRIALDTDKADVLTKVCPELLYALLHIRPFILWRLLPRQNILDFIDATIKILPKLQKNVPGGIIVLLSKMSIELLYFALPSNLGGSSREYIKSYSQLLKACLAFHDSYGSEVKEKMDETYFDSVLGTLSPTELEKFNIYLVQLIQWQESQQEVKEDLLAASTSKDD